MWQSGEGFKHGKEMERQLSVEDEGKGRLFMEGASRSRFQEVDWRSRKHFRFQLETRQGQDDKKGIISDLKLLR